MQDYMVLFFFALFFTIVSWTCSFIIFRKMRFEGFGVSDLWNPTGKMFRRYVQEAKRRNWSMLPVYIPLGLLALYGGYFFYVVFERLRDMYR
jgi:hypothetical protein